MMLVKCLKGVFSIGLVDLANRRELYFRAISQFNLAKPSFCPHYLLFSPWDTKSISRPRVPSKFLSIPNRTKKWQSFYTPRYDTTRQKSLTWTEKLGVVSLI